MPKTLGVDDFSKAGWLQKLRPVHRFTLGFLAAAVVFILASANLPLVFKLVLSWLSFCLAYLTVSWLTIATMPVAFIQAKANKEDGSMAYVFALILLAAFASLFAVLILVINKEDIAQPLLVPVTVASMLLSWSMVHTIYIFHYAHMYYTEGKEKEGLKFPGNKDVDYMDFAYFSFGVGCTFQVADVDITSRRIRRTVFFHSLLSFLLNTFVVALTINIIAGLLN